jgi:tetratricopeptide (TPR) repeat protein
VQGASQKVNEAVLELTTGLDVLPPDTEPALRERLIEGLVGCAAILALMMRDYEQAIAVAQRALQYDPDNVRAQHIRVMSMMGLKDYDGSLALLNELIAKHPDVMDFWWARQMLYNVQGRDAEARQELLQIAKRRPEFVQDLVRVIVEQSKDPEAIKAITEWGQDVGWSAQQVAAFGKLQGALSPEILAEIIGAQFKLMATENPTPQQVVPVRELYAQYLPHWPEAQADLGVAYLVAGRKDDAVAAFERAQSLAPDNPALFTMPALVLFWRGHQAEAMPFLEKSAQMLPDNPGPTLMIMSYLLELGRVDEAKARAEAALQTFPDAAMVRWMYGQILMASGEVEKGWQAQREAYLSDPTSLEQIRRGILLQSAWGLENLREKVKAELAGDVGEVLSQLPPEEMVRLYCEIIRARLEGNAFGEVNRGVLIPVFEELLTYKPDSLDIRLPLAGFHEQAGNKSRAIALLEEVVERTPPPTQDNLRYDLARLYSEADDQENTLRHLRQIQSPLRAPDYLILAGLLADAGEFVEAVDVYDKSLALEEDEDVERLSRFGVFNLAAERWERAEDILRRLLAKQPGNTEGYHHLSEVLYSQQRYEEAKAAAEKALNLAPDSPLPSARLARICQAMGLTEDAASYRQQALQSLPSVANYDQACVLALLGQQDEALARLSDALKATPDLRQWAMRDPDFRELRSNAAFERVVKEGDDAIVTWNENHPRIYAHGREWD